MECRFRAPNVDVEKETPYAVDTEVSAAVDVVRGMTTEPCLF